MTPLAALATLLLLQTPPSRVVHPETVSTVTIVAIGEKPLAASGVFKFSVLILGRDDAGGVRPYYVTYFGPDQPLPPMGSRCTFRHSPGRLEIVQGLEITPFLIGEEIDAFECGPAPSRDELIQSGFSRRLTETSLAAANG